MVEKKEIVGKGVFPKKKILTLQELAGKDILDNFGYSIDITYAPRSIPLKDLHLDLRNFQNRKKPYSENSVHNIIDAVLSGNFDLRIFDRLILWKNSMSGKLYVLAGHSRLEAFKRLSTEYKHHEMVKAVEKKFNFSFSCISGVIMDDIDSYDARFIALMSNALATIETDTERADIYRTFRELHKEKAFIEEFGRKCEKSNRPRIEAYSFLNRNGLTIQALENFENNLDDSNIIKRVALWIGNIRKKRPELSNIHENELVEWLLEKGGYGNKDGQISRQTDFLDIVEGQIDRLQESGEFSPDKKLNILKLKSLSFAMQQYYELLNQLREKKRACYTEFHTLRRNINKKIVRKVEHTEGLDILKKSILHEIKTPIELLSKIEQAEFLLFDLEAHIDDNNIARITDKILQYINKLEQDYYRLKNQKDKFLTGGKKEIEIKF